MRDQTTTPQIHGTTQETELSHMFALKCQGHSFKDTNIQILERKDRWFERGVKEGI